MSNDFEHVLAAGRIGGLDLDNRVLMPAMDMNLCDEGVITAGEIAHYRARAAGGTAMVITGSGVVGWPHGATTRHQPALSDDRFIPGIRALADAVHEVGGRLCIQLCHHGKTSGLDTAQGRPLLVPSVPVPGFAFDSLVDNLPVELMGLATATEGKSASYHAATDDDLAVVIADFAAAATRVQSAGADAVEIHAAHGYLLSTFLSAAYNHRDDGWGGDLVGRARLTCEVTAAVRAAVGPGFPVIVRVNGHEYGIEGGLTAPETAAAARLIERAGADAIHVSGNAHNPFADFTDGPLPSVVGQYRDYARTVKESVSIPVIAVGRVLPEIAEEMIAAGECDFVSMGRQLLADPGLVAKLRSGRRASVRPCINCYVCVEQNFFDATPKCAVNPALGDEARSVLAQTAQALHIAVVGGGPAGMEAARLAAVRGHRVTLFERSDRLGGTAWFSQLTTPANQQLVEWLVHELALEGVEVLTGLAPTAEDLRRVGADVVVVATGARRDRPAVPGAELPHVLTGDDLRGLITGDGHSNASRSLFERAAMAAGRALRLTDDPDRIRTLSKKWMPIGKRIVIVGGGLVGLELAEFLAERNRMVTVLEDGPALGLPMAMPRRWTAVRRASAHGVQLVRNAELLEITPDSVAYRVGDAHHRVDADGVVIAAGVRPDTALADELSAAGLEVRIVGDAAHVGYIEGAIHSAWAVAGGL